MVNWHDAVNIDLEDLGVVKMEYFVLGILMWEILSTLYFDWQFITGKRVFKWPYLLYAGCRFCAFFCVVCGPVGFEVIARLNCQALFLSVYTGGYLGAALGSALLALRTAAVWNNTKIVIGLAVSIWILNFSFLIYGAAQVHSQWETEPHACIQSSTFNNFKIFVVALCTDLAFLAIMLSRIWHNRKEGQLWNLIYRQSVLWAAGATAGELPSIILVSFNFNSAMNQLLIPVGSLAITLCATRMYRELCEYANPVTDIWQYSSIDISPMKFKSPPSRLQLAAQSSDETNAITPV